MNEIVELAKKIGQMLKDSEEYNENSKSKNNNIL